MTARIHVITGPPGSGKTERLLGRYRPALAESPPGALLWLVPNWRAASEMRVRLLDGLSGGCFSPGVMTFAQFAETVLQHAPEPVRPISRLMKRHLVRGLLDDLSGRGRLGHFGPIAGTSGLVDLVCEFISEMKRLEIWPEEFRRACQSRGITHKDQELLELYETYQACLLEHHLYDPEGRFWSARDWLEHGREKMGTGTSPEGADVERPRRRSEPVPIFSSPGRHGCSGLRLVVADGFSDFTRTQHEILETLVQRVEEMWVSLPLEPEPRRAELFRKPLATLSELRRRLPAVRVEELPRPAAPAWPAMTHVERHLFGNPRNMKPAETAAGIEILAGARRIGEIQMIGGRIKRLLAEGDKTGTGTSPHGVLAPSSPVGSEPVPVCSRVRPGEIAVVFRRVQDAADLVSEVFGELGIPFTIEAGLPLCRAPALVALVTLVRLEIDDWPMRDLLAVIGSNYFRPDWPEWRGGVAAAAVEQAIRRWQVPRCGAGVSPAAEHADVPPAVCNAGGTPAPQGSALGVLSRLAAAMGRLPLRATLAEWAEAWQQLAAETGLLRVAAESPADAQAWEQLQDAIREGRRLADWLGESPPELDRQQALAALADLLGSQSAARSSDESGCVRVLSAASARGLRVAYLFVAGLSEKSFPSADREDRLYGEAEYQRLFDEGLPLVTRAQRSSEEMLLFYEVIAGATRRLYLSYPALDESGESLSPSPYLKEVELACGPGRIARSERIDLSPVPAGEEPLTMAEARVKAVAKALDGDVGLLAGFVKVPPSPLVENLFSGLDLLSLRQDRKHFSPAEGMIVGQAAKRLLGERFAPARTFSATEFEQYAFCPFRFLVRRVLGIEPVEEPALEADYLERGRLAHELLATLHRRVNERCDEPTSPAGLEPAEYERILAEALQEVVGREEIPSAADAMREVDRRVLLRWIAGYRDQHEKYDALWRECQTPLEPEMFEVSFGQPLRAGDGPPSTEEPLVLEFKNQAVRIAGRIDRVDTGRVAGQLVFNVLDYKTGGSARIHRDVVARGTSLQLPLYALAVAELLLADRDGVPWQAGYWFLAKSGFSPRSALKMYRPGADGLEPSEEWEEIRDLLSKVVLGLVESMRAGQFPVWSADPDCTGFCPYATVCRINQVRSLEKTGLGSWALGLGTGTQSLIPNP